MPARPPIAAASILSADFSRLGEELAIVDPERDWVHCDIMDHRFVPNLTFGPLIVAAARKLTRAWLDVHLMVERPWLMVDDFRAAGADSITVHIETVPQTREVLRQIRSTGAKAGLAIKPGTPYAPPPSVLTQRTSSGAARGRNASCTVVISFRTVSGMETATNRRNVCGDALFIGRIELY